jgi:hypothetical protein
MLAITAVEFASTASANVVKLDYMTAVVPVKHPAAANISKRTLQP